MESWFCSFDVIDIIGKDSLYIDDVDRNLLYQTIQIIDSNMIIIIHGTDTIDITAKSLNDKMIDKKIVLTGAMIPYSINPIEATANFACAWGYINAIEDSGISISLNSIVGDYKDIKKDRVNGKFIRYQ